MEEHCKYCTSVKCSNTADTLHLLYGATLHVLYTFYMEPSVFRFQWSVLPPVAGCLQGTLHCLQVTNLSVNHLVIHLCSHHLVIHLCVHHQVTYLCVHHQKNWQAVRAALG